MKRAGYIFYFFAGIVLTIFVLTILSRNYFQYFRPQTPQSDTTYVYDTTIVEIPVEVPQPYAVYITDTITDTLYVHDTIPADTAAILADYFRHKVYSDTIADKDLQFYLTETVYANRIIDRETSYKILQPQTITYNAHYTKYVHVGTYVYYDGEVAKMALNGVYTTNKYMIGLGYDPINKCVFFSAGIKIFENY